MKIAGMGIDRKEHKKCLWVVGTRPNFIKLFSHLRQVVVHTGQHYDFQMSEVFFSTMKLPAPKYNLEATKLGEMVDRLVPIVAKEKPDYVVVGGDTNSSLAGALVAAYAAIPIIHIEAGVRSFNKKMPEEINRILIDRLSSIFFAPSETAVQNLEKEGIVFGVYNTGSSMVDAVMKECPTKEVKGFSKNTYRILTLHRQDNVDVKSHLAVILRTLEATKEKFLWPMHPRTRARLKDFRMEVPKNIDVLEPLDHKNMIHLMAFAKQIVTDSGGVQVEAYCLRKPCITLRPETEWVETVQEGWNVLVGRDPKLILKALEEHHPRPNMHSSLAYRNGDANDIMRGYLENLV